MGFFPLADTAAGVSTVRDEESCPSAHNTPQAGGSQWKLVAGTMLGLVAVSTLCVAYVIVGHGETDASAEAINMSLPPVTVEYPYQYFGRMDRDRNQKIDTKEILNHHINQALPITFETALSYLRDADHDKNGVIDTDNEFRRYYLHRCRAYDVDGEPTLTVEEVRTKLDKQGRGVSEAQASWLIGLGDANNNLVVDKDECFLFLYHVSQMYVCGVYDDNLDGTINAYELAAAVDDETFDLETARRVVADADIDGESGLGADECGKLPDIQAFLDDVAGRSFVCDVHDGDHSGGLDVNELEDYLRGNLHYWDDWKVEQVFTIAAGGKDAIDKDSCHGLPDVASFVEQVESMTVTICDMVDLNQDGHIDFNEVLHKFYSEGYPVQWPEDVRERVQWADINGNGGIEEGDECVRFSQ